MKLNETPETFLKNIYNSTNIKKFAIIFVLASIIICIVLMLTPVQKVLYSFIDKGTSGTGLRTSGTFENRLSSLLTLPFFVLIVLIFTLCCLFSKTIAAFLENSKNERSITVLAAGITILLLCYLSIFSFQKGWQFLNGSHAAEMVLGKLLSQENTFVSRNWRYSTEIRLIYQTLFTMPLFKLFTHNENWALIRSLNILLNNLVLILSYFFLARQLKIQKKWIFITAIFLIFPISLYHWDTVTFGGYYIFFIAQQFCCLGLFLKLFSHKSALKKSLSTFLLFTILSFVLGLQGIRSLLCIHIPILISCIYIYLKTLQKNKFTLFLGYYGFFISCAGFAGNNLLHFKYSFYSFDIMHLEDLSINFLPKFGQCLVSMMSFFGFTSEFSLLSAQGLFGVIAIIGMFLLFETVIKSLYLKNKEKYQVNKPEFQFIQIFFICSVIFNISVFIIVNEEITVRYFVPFMMLYIPIIAIFFQISENKHRHLKHTALLFGIMLFLFGQSYLKIKYLTDLNVNSPRKNCIQFLLDNKLKYGFATFWNAKVLTELSNGKIELAGLEPEGLEPDKNKFRLEGWLNPFNFYDPSFHQGESFLLLSRDDWELAQITGRAFSNTEPDYKDDYFIIKKYPSAQIIHLEVLDN
jgi:hypothetical protein